VARLSFGVIDADNHYYEPADCYTRFIEPKYRAKAIRPAVGDDGTPVILVGDRPFTFLQGGFPGDVEFVAKPGALSDMLHNKVDEFSSSGGSGASALVEPIQPAYLYRDDRLELMDKQGIERVWLFPTLGVCTEHFMADDVEQTYANLRAFNRWLQDDWGFNYKERIYAAPLLSLLDLSQAVAELEWAIDAGARLIHLRPGPAFGRSPGDTYFDPFWARVNEAGLGVIFHISESGYNQMTSVLWGEEPNPSSHRQSSFQWTCSFGDRVIIDTVASLIFWNLFERFPNLRMASVENGSLWVPYLLKAMDKYKGMGRNGPWPGGYLKGKPSEVFKLHWYVSPYHEEDVPALTELIGVDHVLFGSDYPHVEGMAEPLEYLDNLEPLGDDATRRIMRDNALEVMGTA
jgi:predicted TIM-barrel fold metal-dependent hydrolase